MISKILIASVFFGVIPLAASASHQAIVRHNQALAEQDYTRALLELHKTLRSSHHLDEETRLDILVAKADFYQKYVGDLDRSLQTLEQARQGIAIQKLGRRAQLDERIANLKKLIATYREEASFVQRFEALAPDRKALMVDEIQEWIKKSKANSPYMAVFHHLLGVAYLEAEQFHSAYNAFHRALEITPAIFFKYPTKELRENTRESWIAKILPTTAKVLISLLMVLIGLGLFITRPWKWIRLPHLLPLPVLLICWAIAHQLLMVLSEKLADKIGPGGSRVIVRSDPDAVLSRALTNDLFVYGLMAVGAIFLASIAISRIKYPITRYLANLISGFCIAGALMFCFVLNHCQTALLLGENSRFQYVFSSLIYEMEDPIPYLLSSPKDYPGLAAFDVDEQALRDYFKEMEYSDDKNDE